MSRKILILATIVPFILINSCKRNNESKGEQALANFLEAKQVLLPNGWALSPAGNSLPLGDFPMNLVVAPFGKYMAVTNNGQSKQTITLIETGTKSVLDEVEIKKSWYGLVFNPEGTKLYASGGNDNMVVVYSIENSKLVKTDSIVLGKPWPNKISPTGMALNNAAHKLYITTKEDSALYIADILNKNIKKIELGYEAYTCLLSKNNKVLYVSLWGGDKVAFVDVTSGKIITTVLVGDNPNEMTLTNDGKFLFVANANDNSVSVVDTEEQKVVEEINSALFPNSLAGSTPNGLALSADESTLYIANADNNCLAVFNVKEPGNSKSLGFIPTGWYPTSVKVLNDKIWVTNGKGGQSLPNVQGPNPYKRRTDSTQYIGSLFKGTLSTITTPTEEQLKIYTAQTYKNSPYNKEIEMLAEGEEGNPVPRKVGGQSPIKYVFYIIKENRTYDQVLGDMSEGNGDSTLCLFPENVTPNHHALAREFVLLDNFYVNAEVSADGHNWSTAAYSNDFVEKTWPTSYGGRGGNYDYEGTRKIAFPKDGFIWDYCERAGVSYRSYGEFVSNGSTGLKSLENNFDADFPSFNMDIPDMVRFEKWKHDFDSLVQIGRLPSLSTLRLPNDHTKGARVGAPTPRAMVAENDMALGALIQHLSNSAVWKESAIFVLEDDAQNGPDHVDAHRTISFVISPYVKRKKVVSRMYSTASMLRTIELILGLPPMSQYDAAATPMWECFTPIPDFTGFKAKPTLYNIEEKNRELSTLAKRSEAINLSVADAAPDLEFNEIIWKTIKGIESEMPSPVRSAFILHLEKNEAE